MAIVLPLLPKGTPAALEYATRKGFVRSVKFQNPGFAPAQRNIGHSRRDGRLVVRSSSGMAPNENDFDLSKYHPVEIAYVHQDKKSTESRGRHESSQWLIVLRIQDTNSAVAVYVGDFEGTSLKHEFPSNGPPLVRADWSCRKLQNIGNIRQDLLAALQGRPMTYDMLTKSLTTLGARVTKVCITALVENTYHARVYYAKEGSKEEIVVDSRPSDALNLAIRFSAQVYINRAVAEKMAHPMGSFERKAEAEVPSDVSKSCKEVLKRFHDPTVVHKVNLQIAIKENRFEDCAKIRNEIEKLLSQDRTLSLVVAMESALEDKRWDEAAFLRNELAALMDRVPQEKLQDA